MHTGCAEACRQRAGGGGGGGGDGGGIVEVVQGGV